MTGDPSEPEGRTALVTGGPLAPDAALAGSDSIPPFLPVRMLNEFTYCARLGYLEWVQGEFTDNDDTVEGRYHHRNVDRTRQRSRRSEDGDDEVQKIHERSVWLGSEALGLSAKIDLLEREGRRVTPIDYKRGKRPHVPRGAYEPELVQLCAQGLLLKDHGYECDEGVLFFVASRERVRVVFTMSWSREPPSSPLKCGRRLRQVRFHRLSSTARSAPGARCRSGALPAGDSALLPVEWRLVLRHHPWDVSQERRASTAPVRCGLRPSKVLTLARRFVQAKIANCRTLIRRNHPSPADDLLNDFKGDIRRAGEADRLDTLLGVEGTAAHRYFAAFAEMLHPDEPDTATFDLESRNRRPPRDPVNALLSLAYAMLTREWTVVLFSVGFDPYLGFYHQPRYGRPALALDLMEEYRPLLADSLVLTVVNNGELRSEHFVRGLGAVSLTPAGRRKFIEAYERRMSQEITHPVFGYRISYRRVLEVQARLLARHLNDEIPEYPSFTTR